MERREERSTGVNMLPAMSCHFVGITDVPQKKKLHVKSVIAKVTGQSDHMSPVHSSSNPDAEGCPHMQSPRSAATDVDTLSDSDSDAQSSNGSVTKNKSLSCCRIDFELDSTVLEGISETIGIIRSHFCYWDHRSVAALIVTLLHAPPSLSGDVEFGRLDFRGVE
jgi:hypothetical protein